MTDISSFEDLAALANNVIIAAVTNPGSRWCRNDDLMHPVIDIDGEYVSEQQCAYGLGCFLEYAPGPYRVTEQRVTGHQIGHLTWSATEPRTLLGFTTTVVWDGDD